MKAFFLNSIPLCLILLSGASLADEITIRILMDPDARPGQVIHEISLPEPAAPEAREAAASGLDRANQARDERKQFGRDRATEASGFIERVPNPGNGGLNPPTPPPKPMP